MQTIALLRHKLLYGMIEKKNYQITRLGDPCVWEVCLDGLNSQSVIISAGVGNDISFEIELHKKTGATIILLDPSPTGKKTIDETPADQLAGIKFLPYGLTAKSGVKTFALPSNPVEGSYALLPTGKGTASFECRSLGDLMAENNLSHVDLLKMDIEGFEWEVLDSIVNECLKITQICVEFHPMHNRYRSGLQRYFKLIQMRLKGYNLISHNGWDHTFLKPEDR